MSEIENDWQTNKPKEERLCVLHGSDYMGDFEFLAEWVKYKNDKKGNGRWMKRDKRGKLVRVDRKEWPDKWRYATKQEFIEYHGLGEEDLRNEHD